MKQNMDKKMENNKTRASPLRLVLLSFILLSFLPLVHADLIGGTAACFGQSFEYVASFNSPLAALVIAVTLLVGLAYMAGQATEKVEITVWAKNEGIGLVWSMVLIMAVLGAFGLSCTVSNAIIGQNAQTGIGPAALASQRLDYLITNYGLPLANNLVQSSVADQMDAVHYAYWEPPILSGGGLAYRANKRAWSQQKDLITDLYLPMLVSLRVQKFTLDLLVAGIAGILLPAALLMRMFFITRDVGNFLLAISFSAFFVVPLIYALSLQASDKVTLLMGGTASNPFAKLSVAQDGIVGDAFQRLGFLATQAILIPNLALVALITATMAINKALKGFIG